MPDRPRGYRTSVYIALLAAALTFGFSPSPASADGDPPIVSDPDAGTINTDVGGVVGSPAEQGRNGDAAGSQNPQQGTQPREPLCERVPSVTCTAVQTRAGAPDPTILPEGDAGIVLAYRARNQLRLPAPQAAFNPMIKFPRAGLSGSVVGFETWYWLKSRPVQLYQRTGNAQFWAQVWATPVDVVWYPGDGSRAVSCKGPGTSPPAGLKDPAKASPTCGHRYERSSADRAGQSFTLQVATMWKVTWNAWDGSSGELPLMITQASTPIAVGEAQALNQ